MWTFSSLALEVAASFEHRVGLRLLCQRIAWPRRRPPNPTRPRLPAHGSRRAALQRRIDRFALEGEHAEDAFVDAVERFAAGESLQRLDAERELAKRERPFGSQAPLAQAVEIGRHGVLRA